MPRSPRVTVLGSLNTDISVAVPALPGPGETVLGSAAGIGPGGKGANQAVASARLGAAVRMIGCVGDDAFGGTLVAGLAGEGVDTSWVRAVPGAASGLALIAVDTSGENAITVAPGANALAGEEEVAAAFAAPCDVLVLSAEIPAGVLAAALMRARASGVTTVLNLAPVPPEAGELLAAGPDWLVVNAPEAAAVLGRPLARLPRAVAEGTGPHARGAGDAGPAQDAGLAGNAGPAETARAAATGLARAGARHAVITLGAAGAVLAGLAGAGPGEDGWKPADASARRGWNGVVEVPGFAVTAVDSVGAGDAFVGALAVAVAAGDPPPAAVRAACAAGAAAVTRRGAQAGLPRPADLQAVTGEDWREFGHRPRPGAPGAGP